MEAIAMKPAAKRVSSTIARNAKKGMPPMKIKDID